MRTKKEEAPGKVVNVPPKRKPSTMVGKKQMAAPSMGAKVTEKHSAQENVRIKKEAKNARAHTENEKKHERGYDLLRRSKKSKRSAMKKSMGGK